jgi:hypothetical protein
MDRDRLEYFGFQLDEPTPYETTGRLPRGWYSYDPPYANYSTFGDGMGVERVRIYPNAEYVLQSIDLVGSKPPRQKLQLPALVILPRYAVHERGRVFYVADRTANELAGPCQTWKTHAEALTELNNWFPGSDPDSPDYDPTAHWREWDVANRLPRWYNLRAQLRRP